MKFVLVVIILVAVDNTFSESSESAESSEKDETYLQSIHACIDQTGISPVIVDQLKNGEFSNEDETTQCFTKCFFERSGFMDAEANLNKDVILEKVSPQLGKDKAIQLLEKCDDIQGENPCNTAFLYYKCFRE